MPVRNLTQRGTEDTETEMNGLKSKLSVSSVPSVCGSMFPVWNSILQLAIDDAFNAVLQAGLAEVQQQAAPLSAQSQIGQNLFRMNRSQPFHRLQFDDDLVFHQQVSAKAFLEGQFLVADGDGLLPLHSQSAFLQFVGQHHFVNGFQKTGAKLGVNVKRSVENDLSDVVGFHSATRIGTRPTCRKRGMRKPFHTEGTEDTEVGFFNFLLLCVLRALCVTTNRN